MTDMRAIEFKEPVLGSSRPRTGQKNSNSVKGKGAQTLVPKPSSANGRATGFE